MVSPDAYVIADYLLTAATRLQLHGPFMTQHVRLVLSSYPRDAPETIAALAFLTALEEERERTFQEVEP